MGEDTPFYAWSIVEAWDWFSTVPYIGFAALVLAGLFFIGFWVALFTGNV